MAILLIKDRFCLLGRKAVYFPYIYSSNFLACTACSEVGSGKFLRNVSKYQTTQCNIPATVAQSVWSLVVGSSTEKPDFQFRKGRYISLLHFKIGTGAHIASCPVGARGSFSEGKAVGALELLLEVKETWIYTSTPPYAFMAYCLIS
jgi:hypothetical protein